MLGQKNLSTSATSNSRNHHEIDFLSLPYELSRARIFGDVLVSMAKSFATLNSSVIVDENVEKVIRYYAENRISVLYNKTIAIKKPSEEQEKIFQRFKINLFKENSPH